VRTAVLDELASAPRRLLDAVPEALWQRMIETISAQLDNSRPTRRALRRLVNRIRPMTTTRAVDLVVRDRRNGLKPEVWEHIAGSRTDLVDAVLDAGWPGVTRRTGRWNAAQQTRYEAQAIRLAADETAEIGMRARAASMIRDQDALTNLVDSASQSLALAAIRGINTQSVLVRCIESRPGPVAQAASRVLADLVDGRWTAASVGGLKEQARLLAEIRPPDAVDALLALWRSHHRDIRAVAATSLLTFLGEDPRAATAVAEAMSDEDAAVRQAAWKTPPTLTRDQLVTRARLTVEAIRTGNRDAIDAYAMWWRLAPDGFDRVVERAGGPYDHAISVAVTSAVTCVKDTEISERVALSLLARIVEVGVDVPQWLGDYDHLATRSALSSRWLVDAYLRIGMPRAAAGLLFTKAVQTLDVSWWRELVTVVGDRPDRLPGTVFVSSGGWNEAAAVEILAELAGIGGYVGARLEVWLVGFGGRQTEWTTPWRERLAELRAHEDVDIRELAGAVRVN